MDPYLLGIAMIPIAISLFCKFALKWEISWLEFGTQAVGGALALWLIWAVGFHIVGMDHEILNGQVTGKHPWKFSCPRDTGNPCRNSYSCDPYTICSGSGKNRSCSTYYHTCYVYPWEQNWYVDTNLPNASSIEIDRVDRQGADMPRRWDQARAGDPAASKHSYQNWVKASAGSLFKDDEDAHQKNMSLMSEYPGEIVDYYNIDRVITPNFNLPNKAAWNRALGLALEKLGPNQQMNAVVVIVNNVGRDYAFGLRAHWQGFKKNDAVIVIGLQNGNITWSEVMSWSKNSIFNVEMRNAIMNLNGTPIAQVDPNQFGQALQIIGTRDFVRRPMAEFEYLKGDIPPPAWLLWLSVTLSLAFGVGMSYLFNRIVFDEIVAGWFGGRRRSYGYNFNRY